MSATRLQHGPNFPPLCICWQVWAPLALSNKLDSGYFPDCLLRKVLAHPRVFCSWLWLMGKLLRIIVLQRDAFPANAVASMLLHVHPVCVWLRGIDTQREWKKGDTTSKVMCQDLCSTCSLLALPCYWNTERPGHIYFVVLQVKLFFFLPWQQQQNVLVFTLMCALEDVNAGNVERFIQYVWMMPFDYNPLM